MFDRRSFIQLVAATFLIALEAPLELAAVAEEQTDINRDWLDKDLALVRSTASVITDPPPPLDVLLAHFPAPLELDTTADRMIGAGLRQIHVQNGGGYTQIYVDVAAIGNTVVALQCKHQFPPKVWPKISSQVLKAWNRAPLSTDAYNMTMFRYVNREKINHALVQEFGEAPPIRPLLDCREAFEVLMSPLSVLSIGDFCGDGGDIPEGTQAIQHLTLAGRFDVIKAVLRGPNPEGRAHAALSLIRHNQLTDDDMRVINKLSKDETPLETCEGCLFTTQKFADIVKLPQSPNPVPGHVEQQSTDGRYRIKTK
jgi:hypothetical protein